MLKRNHLRQFLAIVETGSFTKAAERMGVAQPTLSVAIAELEKTVGTRLFLRERRQIRLTDAGNRLARHARAIESEFRAAEASFSSVTLPQPPFRLGILASVDTGMISRIAQNWQDQTPLAFFEGSDSELRRRLAEGQLEAILTVLRPEDAERPSKILFEEGYRLMVPANHPLAAADILHAQDIGSQTMIARRSCEILGETSRWFTQRGIRPPFFLRSTNDDRCLEMVRAGMGVTTAPMSLARDGVKPVALAEYDFRRTVGLLTSRENQDRVTPAHGLVHACLATLGGL